ncbi:MAG: heavy metal translocating P-type ATPase metal-binding domain-containing protein [Campylobacteraceae bacterium]|nr:heavy metal translocating P-type ATPase metal-binding domain-containing protein [Campylobacteraceae bacterium]
MSNITCKHCQISFDEKVMIKEKEELFFCCKGCQGIYHLLKDENLDSFYDKLGNKTLESAKTYSNDDLKEFDQKSFYDNYVKITSDGFESVNLIIEGIHCAACIWLNEKILLETQGIIEANINFTNNKARIIFDINEIKLSEIIKKIRSVGYNAYAYDSSEASEKTLKAKKDYFIKMMIAVFSSVNIMMLGVAKYTGFFTGIHDDIKEMIHMAEFLLSTPVLFYCGAIFFKGAYYSLKNKIINMDFLVASGATLSYIYSLYILFGGAGESYFDSVTMIITFVLVGKYLEVIGKDSASDTLAKIKSKIPISATIIKNDLKTDVSIANIKVGDIIELKTGEKASVDGILLDYKTCFDESSISGESNAINKIKNDFIYSSSVNLDKLIRYKAIKTYEDSTLNSIVTLIEDSLASKPKIEEKANEFSRIFSIIILSLSFLTFCVWYFLGLDFGFSYENTSVFEKSFIVAISVIVIACPCALALATPMASLIGISLLAKKSLLFKEAKFLEVIAKADTIVIDKTGTLTKGILSVINYEIYNRDKIYMDLLYSLLNSSNHPISKAVKNKLRDLNKDLNNLDLKDVHTLQAKGMSANYSNNDSTYDLVGGNEDLLKENNIVYSQKISNTLYVFCVNGNIIAKFELEDELKDNADSFVSYAKENNLDLIILSGDNESAVKKIAKQVNIDKYLFKVNPIEKADYISKLKNEGKKVIMIGDGINDSIALSRADVSISMGSGTDISILVSDVILLNNSLESLKDTIYISKRTYSFIKQNLLISLVYNMITVPLAVFGLVIPLVAALSMSLSSLLVVLNSLRIKENKFK